MISNDRIRVRHGALESRGAGITALHLHFDRRHTKLTLARFYRDLGIFMASPDGIPMQTEIRQKGEIICLVPLEPDGYEQPLKKASIHLGYTPPDGVLPFIQEGSCHPIDLPSTERH